MALPLLNTGFIPPLLQNGRIETLEDIQLPPLPCEPDDEDIFEGADRDPERSLRETGKVYLALLAGELTDLNNRLTFEAVQQQVKAKTSKYRKLFKENVSNYNIPLDRKKKIYNWFAHQLDRIEGHARIGIPVRFWQFLAGAVSVTVTAIDWTLSCPAFRFVSGSRAILTAIPAAAASILTGFLAGLGVLLVGLGINYLVNTDAVQDLFIRKGWRPALEVAQQDIDHDLTNSESNSSSTYKANIAFAGYGIQVRAAFQKETNNHHKQANNIKYK